MINANMQSSVFFASFSPAALRQKKSECRSKCGYEPVSRSALKCNLIMVSFVMLHTHIHPCIYSREMAKCNFVDGKMFTALSLSKYNEDITQRPGVLNRRKKMSICMVASKEIANE